LLPTSSALIADRILAHHDWPDFRADLLTMAAEGDLWASPIRYTDSRPLMRYYHWRLTGEPEPVVEALRAVLSDMDWELPMYTVAEQSPDRLWLQQPLPNMMMLGDVSMLRNQIFPMHHVSWEGTGGDLAAWVLDKSDQHLKLLACNTSDAPLDCRMRVWKLSHGNYQISIGEDADEDGEFDAEPQSQSLELAKFSAVPMNLPPRVTMLVEVDLQQELDPITDRADLALSGADVRYDAEAGRATVVVHNIGAASAGAFTVGRWRRA